MPYLAPSQRAFLEKKPEKDDRERLIREAGKPKYSKITLRHNLRVHLLGGEDYEEGFFRNARRDALLGMAIYEDEFIDFDSEMVVLKRFKLICTQADTKDDSPVKKVLPEFSDTVSSLLVETKPIELDVKNISKLVKSNIEGTLFNKTEKDDKIRKAATIRLHNFCYIFRSRIKSFISIQKSFRDYMYIKSLSAAVRKIEKFFIKSKARIQESKESKIKAPRVYRKAKKS